MKIDLKYGEKTESIEIPENICYDILLPNRTDAALDGWKELIRGLEHPIGSKRLRDIVNPGEKVAIVTSDVTRPLPNKEILPFVLEEIKRGGVHQKDIIIVFALGSHRQHTLEEKRALVGDDVFNSGIPLLDSDEKNCVNLGYSKNGTPIDIFRPVAEADRIVCLGNIEYHYFAGYSGGAKALMPGVSSKRAIQKNHSKMICEKASAGIISGNPVREDIDEVGIYIKIDFIVNVVLNEEKEIISAFCGDYIKAHREGCRFLDKVYGVKIEKEADIVIVSAGGYPKDINMYQAQKALDNACRAVRKGGVLIWCASMKEGFGSEPFERWIMNKKPEELFLDVDTNFELGRHKAVAIAAIMQKARVFIVSEMKEEVLNKINMRSFPTVRDALKQALSEAGEKAFVRIIPAGGSILPILMKGAQTERL